MTWLKRNLLQGVAATTLAANATTANAADPIPVPAAGATADNSTTRIRRFGEPLNVYDGSGEVVRTLYLYEDKSAKDAAIPGRVVFAHALGLEAVPNSSPKKGLPGIVHGAEFRDGMMAVKLKFRLSSPALRAAAVEHLLAKNKAYFDKLRAEAAGNALTVEAERVAAYDLLIALQDEATGVPLAWARRNVRTDGDAVTLTFLMRPAAFTRFVELANADQVAVEAVYRYAADGNVQTATRRTNSNYAVGVTVARELSSDQKTGKAPIFQADADRISKAVAIDLRRETTADSTEAMRLLGDDPNLLAEVLTGEDVKFADLNAHNVTTDTLARILKPAGVTQIRTQDDTKIAGKQKVDEKVNRGGFGFSLNLDPIGLGGQKEDEDRKLDIVYARTGVRLGKAEGKDYYEPITVKVYKTGEGYASKKLMSVESVSVGSGQRAEYLVESPFCLTRWTTKVVDEFAARSVIGTAHTSKLKADLLRLRAERDDVLKKLIARNKSARLATENLVADHASTQKRAAEITELKGVEGVNQGIVSVLQQFLIDVNEKNYRHNAAALTKSPYYAKGYSYDREEALWAAEWFRDKHAAPQHTDATKKATDARQSRAKLTEAFHTDLNGIGTRIARAKADADEAGKLIAELNRIDGELDRVTKLLVDQK